MERYAVEYRPEAMENLLEVAAYVFELSQNTKRRRDILAEFMRVAKRSAMLRSEALLETT